jgi:hypothetical protein
LQRLEFKTAGAKCAASMDKLVIAGCLLLELLMPKR